MTIKSKSTKAAISTALDEAKARLSEAQEAHREKLAALEAAKAAAKAVEQKLAFGSTDVTEEEIIDAPQRVSAAAELARAAANRVAAVKTTVRNAEHEAIADAIRNEAGAYRSQESFTVDVEALTADFLAKLDQLADELDERNAVVRDAVATVRKYDGGGHDPMSQPVNGVRRVRSGSGNQELEVDGQRIGEVVPSFAVYDKAAEAIKHARHVEARAQRRNS